MIKIQINNEQQKKVDYTNAITTLVANRVSILRQSLTHLSGGGINFSTGDFRSFKAVARAIVSIVGDPITIPKGRTGYINSITNYIANANKLGNINIAGLIQLCDYLLANNEQHLRNILVEDADNLLNLNTNILNNHAINTAQNIEVIKLAFDYQAYDEISTPIKTYFRTNGFTKNCPYCNLESVIHQVNKSGRVVRSLELDHFYDKARHPLLCYSLFNLIPSDHHCNTTNKGTTQFNDTYHLNPHYMGYIDRISFVPVGLTTSYKVNKIEITISEPPATPFYRRINGNNQPNVEHGDMGNLNVFQIRSKYENEIHRASSLLKIFQKENKQLKHLKKYFKALNTLNRKANYIKWYEEELNVRFNPPDFNDKAFSKFCRDIHDYYYMKNKSLFNRYIVELI